MKARKRLFELLNTIGGKTKYLIMLVLRSPVDAILTVIKASFLGAAFTCILKEQPQELERTCILFMIASAAIFLYNGMVWSNFGAMYMRMSGSIRRKMMESLTSKELSYLEQHSEGDILTRMNADATMTIEYLGGALNIPHLVVSMINIAVSAFLLYRVNALLLLLVLLVVIPHVIISRITVAKPLSKLKAESQTAMAEASEIFGAMINSADTVLLYDAQDFLLQKYEKKSINMLKANMKMIFRTTLGNALMLLFGIGGYVLVLVIGSRIIADGTIGFGELTAALQYRGGIIMAAMMLINCFITMRTNLAGLTRVCEFLHNKE